MPKMQITYDETELKELISDYLKRVHNGYYREYDITILVTPEQQDGPIHQPSSVRVIVEVST